MTDPRLSQSDTDGILPVSIGTGIWLVALVILVAGRSYLDANGLTWWIGAAAVGVISGAGGLLFLRWRKRRGAQRQE